MIYIIAHMIHYCKLFLNCGFYYILLKLLIMCNNIY
nr:MAG TPA: hypothetical protein [Caudoviricetes sp.]